MARKSFSKLRDVFCGLYLCIQKKKRVGAITVMYYTWHKNVSRFYSNFACSNGILWWFSFVDAFFFVTNASICVWVCNEGHRCCINVLMWPRSIWLISYGCLFFLSKFCCSTEISLILTKIKTIKSASFFKNFFKTDILITNIV